MAQQVTATVSSPPPARAMMMPTMIAAVPATGEAISSKKRTQFCLVRKGYVDIIVPDGADNNANYADSDHGEKASVRYSHHRSLFHERLPLSNVFYHSINLRCKCKSNYIA